MIGHYLLALTEEQEGWALTKQMLPFFGYPNGESVGPCLLQVTHAEYRGGRETSWCGSAWASPVQDVGARFDALCWRFGMARVNNAIRNRILSNRIRRTLQAVPQVAHV